MTNSRDRSINAVRSERAQRRLNNNITRDASEFERVKTVIQENRDQEERGRGRDDRDENKRERRENKRERSERERERDEMRKITFASTSEEMINFMIVNEELFQTFHM